MAWRDRKECAPTPARTNIIDALRSLIKQDPKGVATFRVLALFAIDNSKFQRIGDDAHDDRHRERLAQISGQARRIHPDQIK